MNASSERYRESHVGKPYKCCIELKFSEETCSFPFTIASSHRSYGAVFFHHLVQQLGYKSPGKISFFLWQYLINPTLQILGKSTLLYKCKSGSADVDAINSGTPKNRFRDARFLKRCTMQNKLLLREIKIFSLSKYFVTN